MENPSAKFTEVGVKLMCRRWSLLWAVLGACGSSSAPPSAPAAAPEGATAGLPKRSPEPPAPGGEVDTGVPFQIRLDASPDGRTLSLLLSNVSKRRWAYLAHDDAFYRRSRLTLVGPSGAELEFIDTIGPKVPAREAMTPKRDDYAKIAPGKQVVLEQALLLRSEGGGNELRWGNQLYAELEPGVYRASVAWESKDRRWIAAGLAATGTAGEGTVDNTWQGALRSAEVSFAVTARRAGDVPFDLVVELRPDLALRAVMHNPSNGPLTYLLDEGLAQPRSRLSLRGEDGAELSYRDLDVKRRVAAEEAAPPPDNYVTLLPGQRTVLLAGGFAKRADGGYTLAFGDQKFAAIAPGKYFAIVEYRGGDGRWYDRDKRVWGVNKKAWKGRFSSNQAPIYLE